MVICPLELMVAVDILESPFALLKGKEIIEALVRFRLR